jgi:hypothetical protein
MTSLNDLSRPWNPNDLPPIDREKPLTGDADHYRTHGWVTLNGLPDDLIDAYCDEYNAAGVNPAGWPTPIPYRNNPALLALCSWEPLHRLMETLIGEPCGLHLNLTGWRSTTRNWHQDGYLNPDSNRDHYIAVWFALDNIHPDSGPFQYIPGSHRWPWTIRNTLMLNALTPDEAASPLWPTYSERILTPLFETEIRERNLSPATWLPTRGQVFLWHPRLCHRGSTPNNPDLERRTLIAHYSGIRHRPDMPPAQPIPGWHFPL